MKLRRLAIALGLAAFSVVPWTFAQTRARTLRKHKIRLQTPTRVSPRRATFKMLPNRLPLRCLARATLISSTMAVRPTSTR